MHVCSYILSVILASEFLVTFAFIRYDFNFYKYVNFMEVTEL